MSTIELFYGVRLESEVEKALLWQYNEAPKITGLIQAKEAYLVDVNTQFWCWYLFRYFYLGEADEYGCIIWSIILNYGISVSTSSDGEDVWGFGDDDEQFDQAPFSSGDHETVSLPLDYVRLALQLRYFQLTTSGTVTQINAFFKYLLKNQDGKQIIVVDNHDMTITYRLNFTPDAYLEFIMNNLDLLPRPAGVEVNWEIAAGIVWGFGVDDEQFDQEGFHEG